MNKIFWLIIITVLSVVIIISSILIGLQLGPSATPFVSLLIAIQIVLIPSLWMFKKIFYS